MKTFALNLFLIIIPILTNGQNEKRMVIRDNHIKRQLTFSSDNLQDSPYLSNVKYYNDSGLVVKEIGLSKERDTIFINISNYNESNELIYNETLNNYTDSTQRCSFSYKQMNPKTFEVRSTCDKDNYLLKSKTKGNRTIQKSYKNGKLTYRTKVIHNGSVRLIKKKHADGHVNILKDFLNENNDIIKTEQTFILKKTQIKSLTKYEYNELLLLLKETDETIEHLLNKNPLKDNLRHSISSYRYLRD